MRIFVKSKPGAREEKVEKVDEKNYVVAVKEPPEKGKANQAIAKALAKYFKVSFVDIILVSGGTSRQKVFDVYLD
jgi:hypothetical protein